VAASVAQTPEQLARLQRNTVKLAGNNYFNGVKCDAPAKLLEAYKEVAKHGYPMADFSAVWQR
ncbi:MAG TPA: hypothetical protein VK638_43845, partial [Edaphobacter sp.]|nr:hypothetical protein [Edaphobacter sp.]